MGNHVKGDYSWCHQYAYIQATNLKDFKHSLETEWSQTM